MMSRCPAVPAARALLRTANCSVRPAVAGSLARNGAVDG